MERFQGSCHCGAVAFELELANGLDELIRCNCSLCRRKGFIMVSVPMEQLTITRGADKLSLYTWNTGVARHYFCSVCGIYTHHRRRSKPDEYGVNIGCLEGVDPFAHNEVTIRDGAAMSLAGD